MEHCDECGFVYASVPATAVAGELRALPSRYAEELRAADRAALARTRPAPATWSALEYTCHVRDMLRVQHERLQLALREARPDFVPMGRDERAIRDRYNEQDVETVLAELAEATERFAGALDALDAEQWQRTGTYHWPLTAERSLQWVARHSLHEGLHHLQDITRGVQALSANSQPS